MKIRTAIVDAVKRMPFVRAVAFSGYNYYWRSRTARDLSRQYKEPPLFLMDGSSYSAPTLIALTSQLCTASQCLEPRYEHWCHEMRSPVRLGRKQWEFVFVLEALSQHNMLVAGRRGLGFGCGREPLPALFAKYGCNIVATDLKTDEAAVKGWVHTEQHASNLAELNSQGICESSIFQKKVGFEFVDMNNIPSKFLVGYDFVWSSCAFEHLGSIRHGLDFVGNTMKCLKPGGIAVHTTEFNLSSDEDTVEDPNCVLFRRRDMLQLQHELELQGYVVAPFNFNPGDTPVDKHIDCPPFSPSPHLKLKLGQYATTSIGLIVCKPADFKENNTA